MCRRKKRNLLIGLLIVLLLLIMCIRNRDLSEEIDYLDKVCHCKIISNKTALDDESTMCGETAIERGFGQKVFSFVLFRPNKGTIKRKYQIGIKGNAKLIKHLFPEYVMRVYYSDDTDMTALCDAFCKHDNIDLCNATKFKGYAGTIWRFHPMQDPLVSEWHSRDLDSRISVREKAALIDWRDNSTKLYHVMRDHPEHRVKVLAGMFGMRLVDENRKLMSELFEEFVSQSKSHREARDQYLLAELFWPIAKNNMVAHDSYHCTNEKFLDGPEMRSFPSRRLIRKRSNYVGSRHWSKAMSAVCPIECRPKNHPDWTTC